MNRERRTSDEHDGRAGETGRARSSLAALLNLAAIWGLVRFASWADHRETPPDPAIEPPAAPAGAEEDSPDVRVGSPAPVEPTTTQRSAARGSRRGTGRRLAGTLVFATLFFAGAAFAAIAGDTVGSLTGSGQVPEVACGEAAAAPAEEDPPPGDATEGCQPGETGETGETGATDTEEPVAIPETDPEPGEGETPAADESETPAPDDDGETPAQGETPAPGEAPASAGPGGPGGAPASGAPLLDVPRGGAPTALDPEAASTSAVVWLHRSVPDPTPPARRLAPSFARGLRAAAARHRVPWSFVLGVVRAEGHSGRVPVGDRALDRVARRLARERDALGSYEPWVIALRYSGRTAFADRSLALTRYNRSVGLRGLVTGLAAAKRSIAARVLADRKIELYAGGRADVVAGRTDVRVLVLLRYLRLAHGSVAVSSLTAGHRTFSRPGVVSAHVYGLAVDIAALGGTPIAGNQEPHGITERAVRSILLLPAELAPQQVISLLGLGGASFPLADHDDHIHVGY